MKIFDKRSLLANIVLEFIKNGDYKLPFQLIIDSSIEFSNILLKNNIKMQTSLTNYDIEKLAYKYFTCLNIKDGSNVLEVSNPELAKMWLESSFKSDAKGFENYIFNAVWIVKHKGLTQSISNTI